MIDKYSIACSLRSIFQGGYLSPQADFGNVGEESQLVAARVAAPLAVAAAPIGIRSQQFDGPLPSFRYAFETENEIQQSAEGELRTIGDSQVRYGDIDKRTVR